MTTLTSVQIDDDTIAALTVQDLEAVLRDARAEQAGDIYGLGYAAGKRDGLKAR